jgi:putative signal transducing protein
MNLVTVYKTFSPADAQLIRSMLEAAEVPATVAHELSALSLDGYALAAGGITVQVPEDRVEFARELITTSAAPPPSE